MASQQQYSELIKLIAAHRDATNKVTRKHIADALKHAFNIVIGNNAEIDETVIAAYNEEEGCKIISAIRVYRQATGKGLKACKEYVEDLTGHRQRVCKECGQPLYNLHLQSCSHTADGNTVLVTQSVSPNPSA